MYKSISATAPYQVHPRLGVNTGAAVTRKVPRSGLRVVASRFCKSCFVVLFGVAPAPRVCRLPRFNSNPDSTAITDGYSWHTAGPFSLFCFLFKKLWLFWVAATVRASRFRASHSAPLARAIRASRCLRLALPFGCRSGYALCSFGRPRRRRLALPLRASCRTWLALLLRASREATLASTGAVQGPITLLKTREKSFSGR